MKIGSTPIGPVQPVYVIAEIGSNHDGNLDQAKQLIQIAADAGADAAKFQLYRADKLYPGQITPGALDDNWLPELKTTCQDEGIEFLCSIFCTDTLAAYLEVRPAAIKIASPEATNLNLLRACAETGLPLIISTGAMDWTMLDRTFATLTRDRLADADYFAFLHCVSAYPASGADLNLAVIPAMAQRYGCPVGFSDHSFTLYNATVAVALGASVIEKHLTPDRSLPGPDHHFASEPDEFSKMVDGIRKVESVLGDGDKRVMPSEDPTDRRTA
jgi:N,N'-diacetyllegionaminate synthase